MTSTTAIEGTPAWAQAHWRVQRELARRVLQVSPPEAFIVPAELMPAAATAVQRAALQRTFYEQAVMKMFDGMAPVAQELMRRALARDGLRSALASRAGSDDDDRILSELPSLLFEVADALAAERVGKPH